MNLEAAASKYVAIAYAELSRGRTAAANRAATDALEHSMAVKIRFLAARIYAETGDAARAAALMNEFAKELYPEPRSYAKVIEGLIALQAGDTTKAVLALREATDLFTTWIGLFDLGRASLAAGAFAQADSSFDVCLNARRGEAVALFVDEEPTMAYLPQAYYYQGLTREGLKSSGAVDAFRQYLAIRGTSTEDPLVRQARERVPR